MRRLSSLILGLLAFVAAPATALPLTASPRPEPRPAPSQTRADVTILTQTSTLAVGHSIRPVARDAEAGDRAFADWLRGFEARARAAGIRQDVIDRAFAGLSRDAEVIARDRDQAEFSRTIWAYLDSAVSDTRVANGRAALARHRDTLRAIERRHGVEAEVVVAVWGLESNYGARRGRTDIVAALASLAHDGRRQAFFETQLIAALRILQSGDVQARDMVGSWAGAMGHTQFMPTSYLEFAVDFDGDGRRNIWWDDPADALASTANYLAAFGWTRGQPWGMEVRLPDGFDFSRSGARIKRGVAHWNRAGVRLADGGRIPDHGRASILLPAGAEGVAFVIFDNFHVIARYNAARAYVIAAGHLSDRIAGGAPLRGTWPRDDRALTRDERVELQTRLTAAGFSTRGVDGILGPDTREAVRRYQASIGWTPDGHASYQVLERLR